MIFLPKIPGSNFDAIANIFGVFFNARIHFCSHDFFFCQIKAVEVALRSCRPSVTNAGVRLNKLATRGRRIVRRRRCQRRTGDALQTAAGRTPVR